MIVIILCRCALLNDKLQTTSSHLRSPADISMNRTVCDLDAMIQVDNELNVVEKFLLENCCI